MQVTKRVGVAALLVLIVATGCGTSSDWQFVRERPPVEVTTRVTVRTDPSGADVSVNDTYLGQSPVAVPIIYRAEVKVYERREALPYPHVESRELKTWVHNVFTFTANKTGYRIGKAEVTLRGGEEREITIKLEPRPR
jgi:hypothetical protein